MNSTPTIPEATEQPTGFVDNGGSANEQNVTYVTREQMRHIKRQQKHLLHLEKKRNERRSQPFANVKMEDFNYLTQRIEDLSYRVEVLHKALFKANVITEDNIKAVLERDKERLAKANELLANKSMSNEDKKKIALEYELPLELFGLTENVESGKDG